MYKFRKEPTGLYNGVVCGFYASCAMSALVVADCALYLYTGKPLADHLGTRIGDTSPWLVYTIGLAGGLMAAWKSKRVIDAFQPVLKLQDKINAQKGAIADINQARSEIRKRIQSLDDHVKDKDV
jgi:hypothetical protein